MRLGWIVREAANRMHDGPLATEELQTRQVLAGLLVLVGVVELVEAEVMLVEVLVVVTVVVVVVEVGRWRWCC